MMLTRSSYASQSGDEAWDALSAMYTHARPHTGSPDARIEFDTTSTSEVSVDRGYLHTAGGRFQPNPEQVNIIHVLGGHIGLDFGRRGTIANAPGDSYLYLPEGSADLEWSDFGALAMRLPMDVVAVAAAGMTGLEAQALRFLSPSPVSSTHARLWQYTSKKLWRELTTMTDDGTDDLRYRALLNLTISAVVTVFPNTAMTRGYVPGPGRVEPPALRRAVAYVDAHASLPIAVADIADAAGTTPRALRQAFRLHLDTTPTEYLRHVRLEAVREELEEADPSAGETVAAVAARWGFTPGPRFDALYRSRFRTSPERTLLT